jgi:hypothetical protein
MQRDHVRTAFTACDIPEYGVGPIPVRVQHLRVQLSHEIADCASLAEVVAGPQHEHVYGDITLAQCLYHRVLLFGAGSEHRSDVHVVASPAKPGREFDYDGLEAAR